ncbi:MarR family winged helix-turn-helix transcriptional regulator [Lachnospiraceae bacterium 46-15]
MISNIVFMEQLNKYYDVWLEYNNVYAEWAKAQGLSVNSLLVLCAIHDGGDNCTQKKISQRWLIPKQTINMVFKDFERKGLVELYPLPEDKRNKVIRFTKAGKEYADTIVARLRKVELSAIEEIGVERMQQLNENMALFTKLFNKSAGGKKGNETNS